MRKHESGENMNQIKEMLLERKQELQNILNNLNSRQKKIPGGFLKINCKNGNAYYTQVLDGKEIYLNKKNSELISDLAQKSYDIKLKRKVETELQAIDSFLKVHEKNNIEQFHNSISPQRRILLKHHVITNEEYAEKWLNRAEQIKRDDSWKKYGLEEDEGFYTEKGEQVRSKSEKIIADKLYHAGIPYVYEMPLMLKGYGNIHPDFVILNIRTRVVYYWEHLGRMDKPDYIENALLKIEHYERNHILPGKQLILTHETRDRPFNSRIIDEIINAFLL